MTGVCACGLRAAAERHGPAVDRLTELVESGHASAEDRAQPIARLGEWERDVAAAVEGLQGGRFFMSQVRTQSALLRELARMADRR